MNDQLHDTIAETVERMVAREATREDIRAALLELDRRWTARRGGLLEARKQRERMLGRLGTILHYFAHGYPGDGATADDLRLIDLIRSLPKSP